MKSSPFGKLRARLFLLVLLALIPPFILILITGQEQREHAIEDAKSNAILLARQAAVEQGQLIDEARQFLATLALLPDIYGDDSVACSDLLARLVRENPRFVSIGVVDMDGSLDCSSTPVSQSINFLELPHIRAALQTHELANAGYQFSPATKTAVLSLAYPVLDSQGNVQAVISAGLDLAWINHLLTLAQLPEGSTMIVVDQAGTILAHNSDSGQTTGQVLPTSSLVQEMQAQTAEGLLEATGLDGIKRLYAYTPLDLTAQFSAYVIIGVPIKTAFAVADSVLLRNLIWLGLTSVTAFLAVWVGGDRLFLRRVDALVKATNRLANGDLSARTQLHYGQGELSYLARAFDQMAESLDQQVTELKEAKDKVQQHLQQLRALRNIDMAITASLDIRVTLNVILDQVVTQLGVDAASVLRFNSHMQLIEYTAGRGFRGNSIMHSRLHLGEGVAGLAALEQRTISVPNLLDSDFIRHDLVVDEDFIAYYAVPLIAKGQVKGVLEIFHRTPLDPDLDWLEFLETLAGQTAIAIDNAGLFSNLQRSNLDLSLAYDSTLEGWSRALDLRDKETEGHSQRVTEMTVHLAQRMDILEEELAQIKRGALLHDIGKMGIPDAILLKPGPLDDEEWEIMRQHPDYAYKLLSPITFLRPALDIPYCHHEKWDGSGYPRGLKGKEIPLAARIFAVVDVWDALSSDRPYRDSWPAEKVLTHIQKLSGSHFDPQVIEVFLKIDDGWKPAHHHKSDEIQS
jgi:HD-GYP domain-containing protein (c-di-GMP phosphodiesterase class II)